VVLGRVARCGGVVTSRVLRYPLNIVDRQDILCGYPILSVGVSREDPNGKIDMWALALDGADRVRTRIFITATGHPLPEDGLRFIGTVITPNQLVWHVWRKDAAS
jgi:hypothetical protein